MMAWLLGSLGVGTVGITAASFIFPTFGALVVTVLKWLGGWLKHATVLQVVCVVLCVALAIDHLGLLDAHRHSEKVETQLGKCDDARKSLQGQLDSISTKRDVQKQVSTRTVEKVVQGQVQVRTVVEHIHDAPNPPDCGTPDAAELRNVL